MVDAAVGPAMLYTNPIRAPPLLASPPGCWKCSTRLAARRVAGKVVIPAPTTATSATALPPRSGLTSAPNGGHLRPHLVTRFAIMTHAAALRRKSIMIIKKPGRYGYPVPWQLIAANQPVMGVMGYASTAGRCRWKRRTRCIAGAFPGAAAGLHSPTRYRPRGHPAHPTKVAGLVRQALSMYRRAPRGFDRSAPHM